MQSQQDQLKTCVLERGFILKISKYLELNCFADEHFIALHVIGYNTFFIFMIFLNVQRLICRYKFQRFNRNFFQF
jgi:hypothetical protein